MFAIYLPFLTSNLYAVKITDGLDLEEVRQHDAAKRQGAILVKAEAGELHSIIPVAELNKIRVDPIILTAAEAAGAD